MSRRASAPGQSRPRPLRRGQLLGLPLSGLLMGPLAALAYIRWLGEPTALMLGGGLSVALVSLAGWIAYRSDYAARHAVAAAALFVLTVVPLLGGAAVLAADMAGQPMLALPALCLTATTVLLPLLGMAWHTWARLRTGGERAAWLHQNVDSVAGAMRADALLSYADGRGAVKPWLVGALSVNVVWLVRLQGGSELQLLLGGVTLLSVGAAWAAVVSVGPALGKATLMLQIEHQSRQRLRHEYFADVQALRRGFWLSRLLMVDPDGGPASTGKSEEPPESREQRLRRFAQSTLYALAASFLIAGVIGIFVKGWPNVQRALYFDGYRPAEVIVTEVDITARRAYWIGRGRVDGTSVLFGAGELDPLIGSAPQVRDDPRVAELRARLPMRAEMLWNPQVQIKLMRPGTSREAVEKEAWFFGGLTISLTVVGVLLMVLAGRFEPQVGALGRKRHPRRKKK